MKPKSYDERSALRAAESRALDEDQEPDYAAAENYDAVIADRIAADEDRLSAWEDR